MFTLNASLNITHLQITSNHNIASHLDRDGFNITHLQITSNHNFYRVVPGAENGSDVI